MSKKPTSTKADKPAKTPKPPKTDRSVGVGHNQLTDDQRTVLLLQACAKVEKDQEKIAELTASIRNTRKTAKADGISPAELNFALHLRKADPDEATAMFRQHVQIAKWLNHPIGKQADLFGGEIDRTPIEERAHEEGRLAGLAGADPKTPYDGVAGQKWMEGFHVGQAVLAKGIKTKAQDDPGHQTLIKGDPDTVEEDDEDARWDGNAPATVN